MNNSDFIMQHSRQGKFITLITNKDIIEEISDKLHKEFGITRFITNSARGFTVVDSRIIGNLFYVERSILTIFTDDKEAEEIFSFLYNYLEIDKKPGSFMYMGITKNITELKLPQ